MPVPGLGQEKSLRRIRYEGMGSTLTSVDYTSTPSEVDSAVENSIFGSAFEDSSAPTSLKHQSTREQGGAATSPHLNQEAPHGMDEFSEFDNNKIICTTLIKSTGKQEWYDNRKLWNKHLNKHLTIYHQIGYYKLFKPFTDLMIKNKHVFRFGKWLAVSRTKDIEGIMNNKSRYIPGMLIRYIFESISFVIGYISVKIKG